MTLMDTKTIRRRILVVDEDVPSTRPLVELLSTAGYAASVISAVDDALEATLATRPALALIGLHPPPDCAAFALGERLRLEFDVPFMVLADKDDIQTARQATESHALGYLVKGGQMHHYLPTIHAVLLLTDELQQLKCREMHLNQALQQGRAVSTATGVLMHRSGLNRQQAFERLRALARRQRRRLHDVAAQILDSEECLSGIAAAVKSDVHESSDS